MPASGAPTAGSYRMAPAASTGEIEADAFAAAGVTGCKRGLDLLRADHLNAIAKVARPAGKRGIAVGAPGPCRMTIAAGLEPCLSSVCMRWRQVKNDVRTWSPAGDRRPGGQAFPSEGEQSELARDIESGGEDVRYVADIAVNCSIERRVFS